MNKPIFQFLVLMSVRLNRFRILCFIAAVLTVTVEAEPGAGDWAYTGRAFTSPVPKDIVVPYDFVAIAGGFGHTIALKEDGTVVAWGSKTTNNFGQSRIPDDLVDVKAIAAGDHHSVALCEDGTVVAWGLNSSGQCSVPVELSDVTAISAGADFTVALKQDGTAIAWGSNSDGQTQIPSDLTGVAAIDTGWRHTVALKHDGTVVAWGGGGVAIVVPSGLSGVTDIAAAGFHTLALKADGAVVAWGYDDYGQTLIPHDKIGLSKVTSIAAGHKQAPKHASHP